ncbi:MAG: MFS transporter [Burkholderiales bacterium]|nr:MFS transporter [Burkholderiales bacterium]
MKKYIYLTMIGHLCTDINQGALPAIMPFLVQQYGFSYAKVGSLVLVANVASALIQPLFGWIGDKYVKPQLMAFGVFLAGFGLSLVGFTESFPLMLLCACISGIGIAMFHPEGGKIANFAASENKGAGLGIFGAGGNIGFTVGPILIAIGMNLFGLPGTWILIIPSSLCALYIIKELSGLKSLSMETKETISKSVHHDNWHGFSLVMAISCLRSIVYFACTTYIPLYFLNVLHQSKDFSSLMLSVFAVGGAFATIIGGRIGDRIGYRQVIMFSYAFLTLVLIGFYQNLSLEMAVLLVVFSVLGLSTSLSSQTVLAQSYIPNHIGTASGLIMGVSATVGGISAPVVGSLADSKGLPVMFLSMAIISAIIFALSLFIVKPNVSLTKHHTVRKMVKNKAS